MCFSHFLFFKCIVIFLNMRSSGGPRYCPGWRQRLPGCRKTATFCGPHGFPFLGLFCLRRLKALDSQLHQKPWRTWRTGLPGLDRLSSSTSSWGKRRGTDTRDVPRDEDRAVTSHRTGRTRSRAEHGLDLMGAVCWDVVLCWFSLF